MAEKLLSGSNFGDVVAVHLSQLGDVRDQIHSKFEEYERRAGLYKNPERNALYGATDALWDTHQALLSLRPGLPGVEAAAKLAAYGLLQALYIQQDATIMIDALVRAGTTKTPLWAIHDDPVVGPIRVFRNRVAGHPVFAQDAGGTAAIPIVVDRYHLKADIYGLGEDSTEDRSPTFHIGELIDRNAQGLLPVLRHANQLLDDASTVFDRLTENGGIVPLKPRKPRKML